MERGKRKERVREAKSDVSSIPVSRKFLTVDDIRSSLRSQDARMLTQALTTLRDQLTIRPDEITLLPQDERLLLAKNWLEESPAAQDVFSIIKREHNPDPHVTSRCLAILAALLNLFSKHFIYHSLGQPIIKVLLVSHMQQLNSNLAHMSFELIISTLELLIAMSGFAGGLEKRSVMDGFAWGQKTHQKLLFLRRKRMDGRKIGPSTDMDVRTLYITFILSFLSNATPTSIKLILLEKHKDTFLLIFKGISQDSYVVARRILEVCWEGVWGDPKISRTLKISLFKESTLNHLLKLYNRHGAEDGIVDHVPADLIHHFMLSIMTRPGVGICFKDRGWYPRDNAPEAMEIKKIDLDVGDELTTGQGGKIFNKILANIVKGLKVNEDARQQELAFKILDACPELVASYWSAANLTLEPRLSSRWITNISILGIIISLPIPTSSFLLPHSTHFNPSPPSLSSILANILPSVFNKAHLTKGLQSPSSLVRHYTALVLSKCLTKLEKVLSTFRMIAHNLEEDNETGQWLQRSAELITEIQRRVPDFMVIVAIVQQKAVMASGHETKGSLLAESALRLLWLYHKLLPRLLAEARFDVGRLLLGIFDQMIGGGSLKCDDESLNQRRQNGIEVLRQLHVLRLLKESDQFVWSNRAGTSSHSYLFAILTLYTKTSHAAVRASTTVLITQLLSSSILFSHDQAELPLWLSALPLMQRGLDAAAPDGTPLTDESSGVLVFLDECIQRCLKTPYRYLEDTLAFFEEATGESNGNGNAPLTPSEPNMIPSPLLMTLLEQLQAKIVANLLSPSDLLAIATFVRKLLCGLISKLRDLRHARKIGSKLEDVFSTVSPTSSLSVFHTAIKRESNFPSRILRFIQDPHYLCPTSTSSVVQEFLLQIESVAIPSSETAALSAAYGLVDWMRFVDMQLHPSEVKRLFNVIMQFSPLAATEFFYQLDPQLGQLWSISRDCAETMKHFLPFEWAYLHSTPAHLLQEHVKDILVSLFFAPTPWNSLPERRISIVLHRLSGGGAARHAELSLLVSIMRETHSRLSDIDQARLKQALFQESNSLRDLCYATDISSVELAEIADLVRVSLEPQTDLDRKIALEYCNYWIAESENTNTLHMCKLASPWIPFMEPMGVIKFLDIGIRAFSDSNLPTGTEQHTLAIMLDTLTHLSSKSSVLTELQRRMHGLLAIRQSSHQHDTLDKLLLQIVTSKLPLGCDTLPLSLTLSCTMSDIAQSAQERWNPRAIPLPLDTTLVSTCLHSIVWDETVAKIVSGSIYLSSGSRCMFWAWLRDTEPPQASSMDIIVVPLHAYLDVMSLQHENDMIRLPETWFLAVVQRLFLAESSDGVRTLCASCVRLLFQASPSSRAAFVAYLSNEVHNAKGKGRLWNIHSIRLFRDLHGLDVSALSALVMYVIHEGLKWMVGQISANRISEDDTAVFDELCNLVSCVETEAHAVEPVMKAAIKSCLHLPSVIRCLKSLVLSIHPTPATVNRLLQSIVQHSQLYNVANHTLASREPIINVLHALFFLHPTNTCQPSHLAPLARLYGGTLSLSDRLLLSIFYLYETQRKESVASIFRSWSSTISAPPFHDALRAVTNLDPVRVLRTYTTFPTRRRLDGTPVGDFTPDLDNLYDPVFLTLLVVQLLSDQKRLFASEWVQVFRSNIISLVMSVLTSRDDSFRKVGVATLAGVLRRVQEAEFSEKDQVIYIMNMLRDILPPSASPWSSTPRLSTYPVVLLAHALRATFYPAGFLYPVVSRFLLQRPELDTTDVPMLYSLLYSCEDGEWTKGRLWMVRFLTEAMHEGGSLDWAVFKRRHTWDIVASMWQATKPEESPLRKGILELLATLSSNLHVVNSLIIRSSLLTWIEMQLQAGMTNDAEHVAWIKILENVIVTADGNKTDKATQGEFSATFSRCLFLLLHAITISDSLASQIGRLQLTSRVLLRVANRSFCPHHLVANVLRNATNILRGLESQISWKSDINAWESDNSAIMPEPPHRARGLFDVPGNGTSSEAWCPLSQWAKSVVALWEVAMMLDQSYGSREIETWDTLTCRLLIMRASPLFNSRFPSNHVHVGEWVRRETVKYLLRAGVKEASREVDKLHE